MGSDEHHPCCAASYDQRKQREYPVYLKLSLLFLSFVFYFLITKGIINIGSDAGRIGEFQESVYSAAKAGVIAFSKVPIYFSSYATLASFSIVLFTPFADISQRSRETQHSTECHMSCIDRTKKGRYGREQHVERFAGNSFISLFFLALSLLPSFFSHTDNSHDSRMKCSSERRRCIPCGDWGPRRTSCMRLCSLPAMPVVSSRVKL